jgi:carboxymethylenebutenolidase
MPPPRRTWHDRRVRTETIIIPTVDGPMPAYEAAPAGEVRGGVVVVQEAFGVTPHIQDVARRFAAAGWHAVAPALFHREGSPVFDYDDVTAVMPSMSALTGEGLSVDVAAAVEHLGAAGFRPARVAIVGFCMGGSVALHAAVAHPLGAAATFYGGGVLEGRFGLPPLVEAAPGLRTPWLGLYGDEDKGIPVEQVERLRDAAAEAPVATAVVRYPGAQHGFHCDARPASYDPAAAADAWARTLAWFGANVEFDGGVRVADAPARHRFEITVGGEPAGFTEYTLQPGVITIDHTEVDKAFGGRGLGGILAGAALDSAAARGLAVVPRCPFVKGWIAKHAHYRDLPG